MPLFNKRVQVYKSYRVRIVRRPPRERLGLAIPRVSPVWFLMAAGLVASVAAQRLFRGDDDDEEDGSIRFTSGCLAR